MTIKRLTVRPITRDRKVSFTEYPRPRRTRVELNVVPYISGYLDWVNFAPCDGGCAQVAVAFSGADAIIRAGTAGVVAARPAH